MFGMDLGEILVIAIVAIIFLGPDKLPQTMVSIAKFIRGVKDTISSTKATIADEMKFTEMKEEVLAYKNDLLNASDELKQMTDMTEVGSEIKSIKTEIETPITTAPKEPEVITFTPKPKPAEVSV